MDVLYIRGLKKTFKGHEVLKGINLTVPEHTVFGFIGPNGAGKTTTMKIVLGLLKKEEGEVKVCNKQVTYGDTKTNRYVGYLPDVPEFYSYMSPIEYLRFCGQITGMEKKIIEKKSQELLELTGLSNSTRKRIGGFSRGMKQRLGIAQALLNEPKLLICDEPTSALDPVGRREILDILSEVKKKTTVIFSTHILSDVEKICDQVAILKKGKIVREGGIEELKSQHGVPLLGIEFLQETDARQMIENVGIGNMEWDHHTTVTIKEKDILKTQQELMKYLAASQMSVRKIEMKEPDLENVFMEAVQ